MSFPEKRLAGKGAVSGGDRSQRDPQCMPPKILREQRTPIKVMDNTTGKRTPDLHGTCRILKEKASVPLLSSRKASITLEAAVALPLALFFLLTLISLFTVLKVQVDVQEVMEQSLDEVSFAAAAASAGYEWMASHDLSDIGSIGSVVWLETRVRTGMADLDNVSGISLLGTDIDDEEDRIRLVVSYRIKIPTVLFPSPSLTMTQVGCRRLWTGAEPSEGTGTDPAQIVYVTEQGRVYHLSRSCVHLIQHTTALSAAQLAGARAANGAIYYPCTSCHPDRTDNDGVFYIGTYGNRYHSTLACPQLRITVYPRRLEEAQSMGLPCCTDCAAAWGRV